MGEELRTRAEAFRIESDPHLCGRVVEGWLLQPWKETAFSHAYDLHTRSVFPSGVLPHPKTGVFH